MHVLRIISTLKVFKPSLPRCLSKKDCVSRSHLCPRAARYAYRSIYQFTWCQILLQMMLIRFRSALNGVGCKQSLRCLFWFELSACTFSSSKASGINVAVVSKARTLLPWPSSVWALAYALCSQPTVSHSVPAFWISNIACSPKIAS